MGLERRFMKGAGDVRAHRAGSGVMIQLSVLLKPEQEKEQIIITRFSCDFCARLNTHSCLHEASSIPADVSSSGALIIYRSSLPFLLIMRKSNRLILCLYETTITHLHKETALLVF